MLGLDPDPARLWPRAHELADAQLLRIPEASSGGPGAAARAALAVAAHCTLVIDAVGDHCVAVKLQVACFERLGAPGWAALKEVVDRVKQHELLVIADAKRGDIDVTAAAYADAFLGETSTPYGQVEGLGADALTVNPLLGLDSLVPFVERARKRGCGLFALVRTSNAGAGDVQERRLDAGGTVSDVLADLVAQLGAPGVGPAGLSDVGAVIGATAAERLEALRERMPNAAFLLPGIGAQGGRVEDLDAAFRPGPAGGLVSASRSIVYAQKRGGKNPSIAAREEAARLRQLAWRTAG